MHSILAKAERTVLVKVGGKTKEQIFQKAFEKMRQSIYLNFNNLIVSLNTLDVRMADAINERIHANKLNKNVEIEFLVEVTYIELNTEK